MKEPLCHCGKPLHYQSEEARKLVDRMVAELGEFIVVRDRTGRGWKVPRHYIALHGPRVNELGKLGFRQVRRKI